MVSTSTPYSSVDKLMLSIAMYYLCSSYTAHALKFVPGPRVTFITVMHCVEQEYLNAQNGLTLKMMSKETVWFILQCGLKSLWFSRLHTITDVVLSNGGHSDTSATYLPEWQLFKYRLGARSFIISIKAPF